MKNEPVPWKISYRTAPRHAADFVKVSNLCTPAVFSLISALYTRVAKSHPLEVLLSSIEVGADVVVVDGFCVVITPSKWTFTMVLDTCEGFSGTVAVTL